MDVFQRVAEVRELIEEIFPDLEEGQLIDLVRQAARWQYEKVPMTKDGSKVFELLMKKGYNPFSTYRHFLLTKSPPEVVEKLKLGLISQKEAFRMRKKIGVVLTASQEDLLADIVDSVRRYIVR